MGDTPWYQKVLEDEDEDEEAKKEVMPPGSPFVTACVWVLCLWESAWCGGRRRVS
jgi:hypothetical protein